MSTTPATTSAEVRAELIKALRLDLVGPTPDDVARANEILPMTPSTYYLTGFLVPTGGSDEQRGEDIDDGDAVEQGRQSPGDDEQAPERAASRRTFFPSSMGLSVLVPPQADMLGVTVRWADYRHMNFDELDEQARKHRARITSPWQRTPHELHLPVSSAAVDQPAIYPVRAGDDLRVVVASRPIDAPTMVAPGTRSVSIFLVNARPLSPDMRRDAAACFQAELVVQSKTGFVARPDPRGQGSDDWDDQVADLQYRDAFEFVVGHNVSVRAVQQGDRCQEVGTVWIPDADVEKVVPSEIDGVEFRMEALANAPTPQAVRGMLAKLVTDYRDWIETQRETDLPADSGRARVAKKLMDNAQWALGRIEAGIASLQEPLAFEAFRIANRAIARAIRQRETHDAPGKKPADVAAPAWRPFQLAFILLNLKGMVDPAHADRGRVDLLFFPTGGGKTEAYLGLAAFTLALRRLKDPSIQSAGLSVLMRYTLRLLTLDQLGRAATMICALELERQADVTKLGEWPFEIGLWVGQSATPNRLGRKGDSNKYTARSRTLKFKDNDRINASPIPLENCPWCGVKFNRDCFDLVPDANNPTDLRVHCEERACEFHVRRDGPLPIVAVDEPIYRRLPAFMIATVDKFANLPWVGQTAGFFGKVDRWDKDGFYGPWAPGRGKALSAPLPPMDLVIQDELHLISGPLGTIVGLYETAIDALSADGPGDDAIRPKIVASTATVRRADKQIRALFGRADVDIFPPPGPDRRDSFFAKTVGVDERNPRTYVAVGAQGRNGKVVLLRTYLALLGAAQKLWAKHGGARNESNPVDPYMTVMGYFNSLRELGGSRRIIEDEVEARLKTLSDRRRVGESAAAGLFADRKIQSEPLELTSRVPTNKIADTKRRLALPFHHKEHVDVAIATNMISVGLDITRLGLMAVTGQPKSAAEYIQATSRVGRDDKRPGIVVALLNVHRPRDRSHYERFKVWHGSFYRAVEATSVTPFSPRALDRALAAVVVSLARLGHKPLTAALQARQITVHRNDVEWVAQLLARRAEAHDGTMGAAEAEAIRHKVLSLAQDLLDAWAHVANEEGPLQYQIEEGAARRLLYQPLDPELAKQSHQGRKFKAQRSMRDVEAVVNLWVYRGKPQSEASA